jgi:hypothetical protein
MNKKLDLILINSFAPRQRIASDAALENSLAIIRTYLAERNFAVHIIDKQRVNGVEQGVPTYLLKLLRLISKAQLNMHARDLKYLTLFSVISSWPLHAATQYLRKRYMQKLIDEIIEIIKKNDRPIVGIKLWYGASYSWSIILAKKIKEKCPGTNQGRTVFFCYLCEKISFIFYSFL